MASDTGHAAAAAGAGDSAVVVVNAMSARDEPVTLRYDSIALVDSGAFGAVFRVRLLESGTICAIKKVPQDRRYKNRELQMMKMLAHPNIVELAYYFYSEDSSTGVTYLCLVMDFLRSTVYRELRAYRKRKANLPLLSIRLFMYQLLRGLASIHALDIVHRDVKPQNLLLDPESGLLKLCDFGTAKEIVPGEASTAYVCSRYYRAPELIFGAQHYNVAVDTWSAGCVMGELFLGKPLFPGRNSVDQLVEIIKLLGTPTEADIAAMNSAYPQNAFPLVQKTPWSMTLPSSAPRDACDLIDALLQFVPTERPACMDALALPFFDELRDPHTVLREGVPLPRLFDFTAAERAKHGDALLNRIAGR